MRLGAMLWVNDSEQPAFLHWKPRSKKLALKLNTYGKNLYGEVAAARFKSLAKSLESVECDIKFIK